jgi:phosphatidylglycerol:prolipoprotein diacylglycerol transferase
MYPYLLEIGPITIASFGAMVALGFISALYVLNLDLKRKGLGDELGSTIITTSMIGGLVGAKLYFVLFETPPNQDWATLFDQLFSGYGLTWYGGFVVASAGVLWQIRRNNAPLGQVVDSVSIALALGYAIGRIGCQLAGDGDYGVPTDLPWAMAYPDGVVPTLEKVHPAPVYETLSHLGIAALLWSVRTRIQTPGASFAIYLILAGVARFAVESIRINPRVLWGYSEAQLISIVFVLGGLFLAVRLRLKGKE